VSHYVDSVWRKVIPWFAELVGHTPAITTFSNGSGDTTYNYFQILFFAVLSILMAVGVGLIDNKRDNYNTLLSWLTILIRYYVALQMINYGLAKLFTMQFGSLNEYRLSRELGDYSPMGLLWTFMGFSKGYSMFTGALELIGGLLLLSRYTVTLGALTTFGVMLNVMVLNYCYDVPVKILSTHLVLLSLILVALDRKRLVSFFLANQSVNSYSYFEFTPSKYRNPLRIVKWVMIGAYLIFTVSQSAQLKKEYTKRKEAKALFQGKYLIESFDRELIGNEDGRTVKNKNEKWITFDRQDESTATIKTSLGHQYRYSFIPDTLNSTVRLKVNGVYDYQELQYEKVDDKRIHLYGKYGADTLNVVMKKQEVNDRLLINRGFHWVNEYPFNR